MLVIRDAQLAVLADAQWRDFQRTAYTHCWECFPDVCGQLGDEEVWTYIETGLSRARSHGFETARNLLKYLNLVFTFGLDFDRLPWAEPVLADHSFGPATRMDILTEAALAELQPPEAVEETAPQAESESAEPEDAFAGWPETPPAPVPEPPSLAPPGATCAPAPPPDLFRMDAHYAW